MHKQLRALFSGRVQGVGFRFTAERLARHFEVRGYVRNLPDGKVELLVEGEEMILKDFLKAVKESQMAEYIRDIKAEWTEPSGRYQNFGIAY